MHVETSLLEAELLTVADATSDEPLAGPAGPGPSATPQPEHSGMEIPGWVWTTMMIGYAMFFLAIFAATGGGRSANFAIAVSILYTAMYFGTARALLKVRKNEARPFTASPARFLQTWTGPMSEGAVAAQMLVVPVVIGLFAVVFAIIRAIIL
jgi:hypothetical protein